MQPTSVAIRRFLLSDCDEQTISLAFDRASGSRSQKRLVHGNRNSLGLTYYELNCLLPNGWLNDQVMNVYAHMLGERSLLRGENGIYFVSTFFMTKLLETGEYNYMLVEWWIIFKNGSEHSTIAQARTMSKVSFLSMRKTHIGH